MKFLHVFAVVLLGSAPAFATEVFKCKRTDGSVEFSSAPCSNDPEKIHVESRSPYEKADAAKQIWRRGGAASIDEAKQCLEAWRPSMKDPDSARLLSDDAPGLLLKSPQRTVVAVEGRARNGFGGMGVQYFVCDVNEAGKIVGDGDPYGDLQRKAGLITKNGSVGLVVAFPGVK